MFKKNWKKILLIIGGVIGGIGGIGIAYAALVIFVASSIPSPTDQQLDEAAKVAERYISENAGEEIKITSTSFRAEMYDRTIEVEGHSKNNFQQVFHVNFEQVKGKKGSVTEKSINTLCTSSDNGNNFQCKDVKRK